MDNQVDVKFRLKQRKVRSSQSKREGLSTENVLITMRVTYLSMRLEFSTEYHIDVLRWDQNAERAIGPNRDGQSADEINGGIMRLARNLAQRLGKTETEVSRWLSGTHNLTLSTICKDAVSDVAYGNRVE